MANNKKPGEQTAQDSVVEELFGALKGGNVFKNRRVQNNQPPGATPPPALAPSNAPTTPSKQPVIPQRKDKEQSSTPKQSPSQKKT